MLIYTPLQKKARKILPFQGLEPLFCFTLRLKTSNDWVNRLEIKVCVLGGRQGYKSYISFFCFLLTPPLCSSQVHLFPWGGGAIYSTPVYLEYPSFRFGASDTNQSNNIQIQDNLITDGFGFFHFAVDSCVCFPSGILQKWVVLVKKDLVMWVSWANI